MAGCGRAGARHHPDVLLLDARMPLPEGLATIRQISPLTRVVTLTSVDDANLAMGAVRPEPAAACCAGNSNRAS